MAIYDVEGEREMESAGHSNQHEAAYITIVEGPPPEFSEVDSHWTASLAEGRTQATVATCETRTFNGQALVERCRCAWEAGRPARLKFPQDDGRRAEVEIVAARWQRVPEGQKLILWVKLEDPEEMEANDFEL
jgi:hypothetical protein